MGEYNKELDKVLAEESIPTEKGGYDVKICSYDGKPAKVQIQPTYLDKEGQKKYAKLGRIYMTDFIKICKAVEVMYKKLQ